MSQAHFNSLISFRPSEVKSFEPGTALIQGILVQVLNAGSAYIDNNFIFNTMFCSLLQKVASYRGQGRRKGDFGAASWFLKPGTL